MNLSHDQETATQKFLDFLMDDTPELVLTAPPGRGKTYITKHLIQKARDIAHMLQSIGFTKGKPNIYVTATTNTAADVASTMLGERAQTIHSFLGLTPKLNNKTWKEDLTKTKRFKVLAPSIVVVDEAGSVNSELLAYIREACIHCKVLYVGDDAQTAPVGEVFCPVFEAGIPTIELTTNHRNMGAIGDLGDVMREAVHTTGNVVRIEQEIVQLVRSGNIVPAELRSDLKDAKEAVFFPPIVHNGVDIIKVTGAEFQAMVDHDYVIPDRKETDGKIVCWRNTCVGDYNNHIRGLFTDDERYMVGELVITNKPITVSGSMAASTDSIVMVTSIAEDSIEKGIAGNRIRLNDSFEVFQAHDMREVKAHMKQCYKTRQLDEYHIAKDLFCDLRPSHACTVHKSQGKTYQTVYLNLDDIGECHEANAVARMLNTGITRAAIRLVIYGDLPVRYGG